MEFKIYASAVIEQNGRILLVQEGKADNFEKWNLPGGHLELAEMPLDGAKRETFEETALTIEVTGFLGVYSSVGANHSIRFVYCSNEFAGEAKPGDEILAVKWFEPVELRNLDEQRFVSPLVLEAAVADYVNGRQFPATVVRKITMDNKIKYHGEVA